MIGEVEIIGVPLDLGANIRGALMGPAAIRIAGLGERIHKLGYSVHDSGDVEVPIRETLGQDAFKERYLTAIHKVCAEVFERTQSALKQNRIPIAIGGDHSLAVGSISAVARHFHDQKKTLGLLWIDAHADLNTPESSESGNIHGMPLATVLGKGHNALLDIGGKGARVDPKKTALIGIRDIDEREKIELRQAGIRFFTMRDIDERGKYAVMEEALKVVTDGTDGIHLSCDIDGVDPMYAPGVSTPVTGGLSYREIHLALEMLADSKKLVSMDLVELNPCMDHGSKTADLAVELILSALGKSIV